MTQPLLPSEQLAFEWANRLCDRLVELNLSQEELDETRFIIFRFTKTAADELSRDRTIPLSYTEQALEIDPEKALLIIELFLRGVFQSAQQLRESGKPWDERRPMLETLAWKLFSVAKLLVGFWYIPHAPVQPLLQTQEDLQTLLKQSTSVLVEEELTKTSTKGLPFDLPGDLS
jgi:hypothetical protein